MGDEVLYPLLQPLLWPLLRAANAPGGASGLDAQILQLFRAGEKGAWYDPSDMSTMWQDAAMTTRAQIGSPVGAILDKSGNGFTATQAVAGSRPTLQQTNGLNYLQFDGVDDFLQTASIDFTAGDKMSVWCGVRKTSDAAQGTVVELSVDRTANNGTFSVHAPNSAGSNVSWVSKGTSSATAAAFSLVAPITVVLSGQGDIAAPSATIRVNGSPTTVATTQGTGNFGNYPLFVGMRGGASLPFVGNLYGLIVRGAASTATQVTTGETYMNQKAGAF